MAVSVDGSRKKSPNHTLRGIVGDTKYRGPDGRIEDVAVPRRLQA
jgi:hypothetical protein